MVKPVHKNWVGFTQIRDTSEKIIGAKCNMCNKLLKKRDSDTLMKHRKVCKGPATEATKEVDTNLASPVLNKSMPSTTTASSYAQSDPLPVYRSSVVTENISEKELAANSSCSSLEESTEIVICTSKQASYTAEKDVMLLKFCLYYNIHLDTLNSKHTTNLLQAFDPLYTIPNPEDMQKKVLTNALKEMHKKNSSCEFLNILNVLVHNYGTEIYTVSFIFNNNDEHVYITDSVIRNTDNVKVITDLEDFCDRSVQKVNNMYQLNIKFVIFDSTIEINQMKTVDEITYYVIKPFYILINILKNDHPPFLVKDQKDIDKSLEYMNALDNLQKQIFQTKCPLADAVEYLFKLVDNGVLLINPSAMDDILKFLSPVYLVANFFVPDFKGHFFISYPSLSKIMYDFIFQIMPMEAFDGLSKYKHSEGIFSTLFDTTTIYDRKRFWQIVKMDEKSLSTFAMNFINLPSGIKNINIKNLRDIISKSEVDRSEDVKVLLMSIFLNE